MLKRRRRAVLAAGLLTSIALTACAPNVSMRTAAVPQDSQAVVAAAFLGRTDVDFRQPLTLASQHGRLTSVAVVGPDGTEVAGELAKGGTEWAIPARALSMETTYQVKATAVDRYGQPIVEESSFTTMTPTNVLGYSFSTRDGATYGVGMPISVNFDKPVADKAAVESRLVVATSTPIEGSWSWQGDKTVTFRPRAYWPAGTHVEVKADLRGVEPEPDLFAMENKSTSLDIGSSFIAVADAATHQMTVTRNGEVVRTMPITTGKPGWETRSGIKVIVSKDGTVIMDASTLGVDKNSEDYYRLKVDYAMRLTYSGEFVHAAPWSVASQGNANVSHGCVGMSNANAAWLFANAKVGDIVQVTNTNRQQNLGNGITVWNESWESWLADSALGGSGVSSGQAA